MNLDINQILKEAIGLLRDDKFEEAEFLYQKILEVQPKHPDANHNVGIIKIAQNKISEALILFKIAIEENPNVEQFWVSYTNSLIKINKLEEAEKNLIKVLKLKPNFVEAHNNLGITLHKLGRLKEAEMCYKKVIKLNPNFTNIYYNIGNLLSKLNKLEEAEVCFKKFTEIQPNNANGHYNLATTLLKLNKWADSEISYKKTIELKPDYAAAYNNLGVVLRKLNRPDEAEKNFTRSIEIDPAFEGALINRGKILLNKKNFELALQDFDSCNSSESRWRSLVSLYALNRIDDIYQRIELNSELDEKNIGVAAFSSFISKKEKNNTAHNFCNNPMDFIHISNLASHIDKSDLFINKIIKILNNLKTSWEPSGKSTHKGFQSSGNLFVNNFKELQNLRLIIINEIDKYHLKFQNESCFFIKKWPSKENLYAWYVNLKKQGYQAPHIHKSGWLSGVIYLKVVPALDKNEGAIEFSLNGENYFDASLPKKIHKPKVGDMVFFPSSLHHGTIPFTTDSDRIIISFDLMPNEIDFSHRIDN